MVGKNSGWIPVGLVFLFGCTGVDQMSVPPTPDPKPNLGQPPVAAPPANVVGGFSAQIPEFTLEPGDEKFPCWLFPLEIEGPSHIVGGARLTTTVGMHHGNITSRPITGEGIRECETGTDATLAGNEANDIIKGGAVLFGSSTQIEGEEWQSFPDGMGYPVSEGYEIVARMHYLNATSETITLAPSYDWYTIDEATVEHVLGPFAWVLSNWEIPPLTEKTVEANCRLPGEMHLVNLLPHMHGLGTAFFGSYMGGARDGEQFLDSAGYDPDSGVLTQYTPAIDLSQGEGASFGCTWMNTFDKPIGEGVGDDEMCILFGYAYPYEGAYSALATEVGCAMLAPPPPGR